MEIGIFAKKRRGFTGKLQECLQARGHSTTILSLDDSAIDVGLTRYDGLIIKTKHLFFLYGGFYAKARGIPVVPDPEMTRRTSNRLEFPFLAKTAGIQIPNFFVGFPETIRTRLESEKFPLVLKSIVGGGSRDVHLIHSKENLPSTTDRFLYLEEFLTGDHILVYFINDQIRVFQKEPWSNEHGPVKAISLAPDIQEAVHRWQAITKMSFGHLDFVRDANSGQIRLVDPGAFPQFTHWPGAPELVTDIILNAFQKQKIEK